MKVYSYENKTAIISSIGQYVTKTTQPRGTQSLTSSQKHVELPSIRLPTTTTLRHRVNVRNRQDDFIGIYGVFVTSGAEYIGAVGVPGVCKCVDTDRAPTCSLRGLRGTKRSLG